jgi:hypothetical protein
VSPLAFSPFPPSVTVSASGLLIVCRVRDDETGGMEGHVSRDCTMEQKAKSCYRCGREGHIVRCVPRARFEGFLLVISLRCSLLVLFENFSRVIAPILRAAAAAAAALDRLVAAVLAVLERNAIAAARLVTLRVRAPRRPEAAQEATAVVGEAGEATVVLGAGAVKKHGALSQVLSHRSRGTDAFRSYTCGGVGHLSRDCGQGSKCYNCSGVVSVLSVCLDKY